MDIKPCNIKNKKCCVYSLLSSGGFIFYATYRLTGMLSSNWLNDVRYICAYSGAAEPPVRRGVSHVSGPDGATLWELK